MKLSQKGWKLLLPVVVSVGLVGGSVEVAGASTSQFAPPPASGQCSFTITWQLANPDYVWVQSHYNLCYYKIFVLAGVYGNPATYHWIQSTSNFDWNPCNQNGPCHTNRYSPTLPAGQIVLSIVISDNLGPNYWDCWNVNQGFWYPDYDPSPSPIPCSW